MYGLGIFLLVKQKVQCLLYFKYDVARRGHELQVSAKKKMTKNFENRYFLFNPFPKHDWLKILVHWINLRFTSY